MIDTDSLLLLNTCSCRDCRLLSILGASDSLMKILDPDDILHDAVTQDFFCPIVIPWDDSLPWRFVVSFPGGERLMMGGKSVNGIPVFHSAVFSYQGKRQRISLVKDSHTVMESLGELQDIPVDLKRQLSAGALFPREEGKKSLAERMSGLSSVLHLVCEALLSGVDGVKGFPYVFRSVRMTFSSPKGRQAEKAVGHLVAPLPEGAVEVSAEFDPSGVAPRHVYLDRNLGLGRRMKADCTVTVDGRPRPSLRVAADLDSVVPVFYVKSRNPKVKKRYPKG